MLVLLSETRKKLLWLWLICTALIMALFLVQTINDKYENIVGTAWTWAFANLLPCLLLLYVAVLLNKNASKLILQSIFRLVYIGALAYLVGLFVILLAMPFAETHMSIAAYFQMSYFILVPFQMLLIVLFSILYFKKEPLFVPNAAIVQSYTAKRAEAAQGKGNLKQEQAFALLLQEPDLENVLTFLHEHLEDDNSDIILLQNQRTTWQRNKDLSLATPDALQRQLNNLTLSVLSYIEKL